MNSTAITSDIYPVPTPTSGRLFIVARPRGGDWLTDDVARWKQAGVTTVVSMLTPPENTDLDLVEEGAAVHAAGMKFVSFPISDRGVPVVLEPFQKTIADLSKRLSQGESVALHCRMSVGRAPLVAAGILSFLGVDPDSAFRTISEARGVTVPETVEQRRWIEAFAGKSLMGAT